MSCGACRIFDLQKHREVGMLMEHTDDITSVKHVGNANILSGDTAGNVMVWRCQDWVCLHKMTGHK